MVTVVGNPLHLPYPLKNTGQQLQGQIRADAIYSPKIAERVFDQIILDMQLEWAEVHDQKWLARWVVVRGVLTVVITAAVHAVATLNGIFKLVK